MSRSPKVEFHGRLVRGPAEAERVALAAIRTSRLVRVTPHPDDLYLVEVRAPENATWLDDLVMRVADLPAPEPGDRVQQGDGTASTVTRCLGRTRPGFGLQDGDWAVTVEGRGDRVLYVERLREGGWLAGGEDFQDSDPLRSGL